MNTRTLWTLVIGALLVAVAALTQAPQSSGGDLARYVPEGSLLVLEAENFAELLRDWNGSPQKTMWLASDNYDSFSRTKLFLRLQEAQSEFAAAAGLPADMPLVESVAGRESILALYDIGSLQFLYITRLPSAQAMESALWQTRANFEPRNAGGRPYYLRADATSQREVAFAATDDYLMLATNGDVLAGSLRLMAGEPQVSVTAEPWYADAAAARSQRGELRMLMNLERLVRTAHFRSYWIHQNVSEVARYRAGVADLFRSGVEFKEERTFLPARTAEADSAGASVPPAANMQAAADLLRFAPPGAGFHAARPFAATTEAVDLLAGKLLSPQISGAQRIQNAPQVYVGDGRTGYESALETRIDEPPAVYSSGSLAQEAIIEAFESNPPLAALQVESSRKAGEDVFVGTDTAFVLVAANDWDAAALGPAFESAVRGLWTTSSLGAQWAGQSAGGETFHQLSGLTPLVIAVRGRHLFLANSAELLIALLGRANDAPAEPPVLYAAQFRRSAEQANYETLMGHLDYLQFGQYRSQQDREPEFFSENIASLGRTLERVESMSIRIARDGESVNQAVVYRLSQ